MGVPMAAHLERAGYAMQTYDVNGKGNRRSVREAAQGAEALVTMLPDGRVVHKVVLEALPALAAGTIVIDMSSSDPAGTRKLGAELERKNVSLVDAPVSGAVAGARNATLAIMAGGDKAAFEKARPLLEKLGKQIFHVGPVGAGHAVKTLNNYLGAAGTLAGFEALLLAQAFGLDPQLMLEAINASTGHNYTTERKIPRQVLTGAFASGFKLALMTKDVGIAAGLARDLGLETPYLRETLRLWRAALRELPAGADHTEIFRFQQRIATPSRAAASRPARSRRKRRRST